MWEGLASKLVSQRQTSRLLSKLAHCACYNRLISEAKLLVEQNNKIINENKDKPQNIWNSINHILHRSQASPLTDCSDLSDLANTFKTYFNEKIQKIKYIIESEVCTGVQVSPWHTPPELHSYTPISEVEARKLILSSTNQSCDLDQSLLPWLKNALSFLLNL